MILRSQILGQNKFIDKLDTYTVDTFPHSFLLLGDKGSGKHLISTYIAENILNIPLFDITANISSELLDNIYVKGELGAYLINIGDISEKEQNSILKFVEEPLPHIFIILLSSSRSLVLPTILNRCVIDEIGSYTADILRTFLNSSADVSADILENILRTPGRVKVCDLSKIAEIYDLCDKILEKIDLASYSNTLSISQKINYKDSYDKYDFDIFCSSLCFLAYKKAIESTDKKFLNIYLLIADSMKQLQDSRLNKEIFIDKLLSKIWRAAR